MPRGVRPAHRVHRGPTAPARPAWRCSTAGVTNSLLEYPGGRDAKLFAAPLGLSGEVAGRELHGDEVVQCRLDQHPDSGIPVHPLGVGQQLLQNSRRTVALSQPKSAVERAVPLHEVVPLTPPRRHAAVNDSRGHCVHGTGRHLGFPAGGDVGLEEARCVKQPGTARVEVVVAVGGGCLVGEDLADRLEAGGHCARVPAAIRRERRHAQHTHVRPLKPAEPGGHVRNFLLQQLLLHCPYVRRGEVEISGVASELVQLEQDQSTPPVPNEDGAGIVVRRGTLLEHVLQIFLMEHNHRRAQVPRKLRRHPGLVLGVVVRPALRTRWGEGPCRAQALGGKPRGVGDWPALSGVVLGVHGVVESRVRTIGELEVEGSARR
eukprot:Hpha_TRINITY_DN13571_c0_g1::TRINITY_DN13571_c0_g1_i1::g.111299::m.111299